MYVPVVDGRVVRPARSRTRAGAKRSLRNIYSGYKGKKVKRVPRSFGYIARI